MRANPRSSSYTATQAKNDFGRLLEQAIHGEPVVITKHGAHRAYLISAAQYDALRHEPEQKLSALSSDFDRMLARMQTARFRTGIAAAFHASPEKLGKAAVAAARKRG
jgi:antitoxin Phd